MRGEPGFEILDFGFRARLGRCGIYPVSDFRQAAGMTAELVYPHIAKQPGEPACLERHPRTRVAMLVADYLWRGWSAAEIARQYPYLSLGEIHAALACYFDHREELEAELAAEYRAAATWKETHPTPSFLARLKEQARA
jgi:uncharacterized protein (DUF433 family)